MTQWHMKSMRKPSGGVRHSRDRCDKKLSWRGSEPTLTTIGPETEVKKVPGRGKTRKEHLKYASHANICLEKNKVVKAPVLSVLENTANRQYARQSVLTKNAIIEVEISGKKEMARVSSRPGQHGVVNAVLVPESERAQLKEKASKKKAKVEKKAEKKGKAPKEEKKVEEAEKEAEKEPEKAKEE